MGEALAERMQAQLLTEHDALMPSEVVGHLGALQSQDFAASRWAIGVRSGDPAVTNQAVIDAFDRGEIVRGWPMRGTLHTVLAGDIGWMLSLTAQRTAQSFEARRAALGIDSPMLVRATEIAVQLLAGGRRATRAQLQQAWAAQGIPIDGGRGYHLVFSLAHDGLLVWGPVEGSEQQLVLAEEWIAAPRTPERDEALGMFLRAYLRGRGPASALDFRWWSGLTAADAKTALAVLGDEVEQSLGMLRLRSESAPAPQRDVLALPAFDEHLLGYRDRELMLDPAHFPLVVPGSNGVFQSTIVARGRVVATWHRTRRASGIDVEVRALPGVRAIGAARLRAALGAYGRFTGERLRLV